MPEPGVNSYLILGEQGVDWDTSAAALIEIIYEFVACGLRSVGDNVIPNRMQRNPSPTRGMKDFIHCEGDIQLHLHADDMLVWWKHILMDAAISPVDFTTQEVFGNGSGVAKGHSSPESLDTQPSATSPSSAPGKLTVSLAATDDGTITITGTNWGDQAITEVLTYSTSASEVTTNYFKTVDASGIVIATITEDMLIMCDRNIYTHTIELGDAIDDGLTMEVVKGVLPSTYIGVLLNSGVLSIGDVMTLTVNCMGKRGYARSKFAASATPALTDTPTDVSGYGAVQDLTFTPWAMGVRLEGSADYTDVETMEFSFSNGLIYPRRHRVARTEAKPVRGGSREISISLGLDYEAAAATWEQKFLDLDTVAVVIYMETTEEAGPLRSVTINGPKCQITSLPDPEVSDYSQVMQPLVLMPYRTGTSSDEITVVIEDIDAAIP